MAISMLTGIMVFADTQTTEENYLTDVVVGLGFIDKDADFSKEVTRGEFASIALRLYNLPLANAHEYGTSTRFADVPAEHYKSADIMSASKMGIMNGYTDGNFYPEKTLIMSEAVKIVMDLLGYADYIPYVGGYPVGYMTTAAKEGVIRGMDKGYNSVLTYGDLAEIIYNIIELPMVKISVIGQDKISFSRDENITFLTEYHEIYKGTGVLSGTAVTKINSAYSADASPDNTVTINDTIFQTKTSEFDKLLGMNTEFYYHDDGKIKTLVYAIARDNKVAVFAGEDVSGADSESIEVCDEKSNEKLYRLEETGNVIYNGIYAGKVINYPMNTLSDIAGTIRITDTDTDGSYDVVFITEYKNYIVDKSSVDAGKIIFKDNAGSMIVELENDDVYCEITKSGEELVPEKLETGMVVSIADSSDSPAVKGDKRCVSVVVSDTSIKASVSELSDGGVYLWQKGEEGNGSFYELARDFFGSNGETKIILHSNGVFHLDALGKIAYYSAEDDAEMKFGYIIEAGMQGSLDKAYGIKLLSQSGEILCLYTADNLKLDGSRVPSEQIHAVLEASSNVDGTIKQLVKFRTNSNGLISELDTANPNSNPEFGELTRTHVTNGATYKNNTRTFVMSGTDERYILSNSVKVFLIPTDPQAREEDYQVRSASYFSNNTSYGTSGQKLFVYNVDEAEPQAMELQVSKVSLGLGGVSQYNSDLAIVMGHSKIAGEDGDEYISLKVMVTNAEKKLKINPDRVKFMRFEEDSVTSGTLYKPGSTTEYMGIEDFKFGDLILFYEDDVGETRTVLKLNENDPYKWKNGSYGIMHKGGYLERMYGAVLKADERKLLLDVSSETYPERTIYANLLGSLQVYLVDFTTETVRTASFNDIVFSEIDSLSDKVFVRTRSYVPKQVVIYRGVEVTK